MKEGDIGVGKRQKKQREKGRQKQTKKGCLVINCKMNVKMD